MSALASMAKVSPEKLEENLTVRDKTTQFSRLIVVRIILQQLMVIIQNGVSGLTVMQRVEEGSSPD